jgi:hypothetical protein
MRVLGSALAALIVCTGTTVPTAAQQRATATSEQTPSFNDVLRQLRQTRFRNSPLEGSELRSNEIEAGTLDQTRAVPAIYRLWVHGDVQTAELLWWQRDDRLSRVFVLMLFYCAVGTEGEAMANFPDFPARRYASPEREERIEEIEFVRKHRSALAKKLVAIFKDVGTKAPRYKRYVDSASRGEGDPLPDAELHSLFRD